VENRRAGGFLVASSIGRRSRRSRDWAALEGKILACERCPRLRAYCLEVARRKRAAYRDEDYWGRPVPGFGDRGARILLVGLAPAAHGANRTGRLFTGDRSGDFLFGALYRAGLASAPRSVCREDGLELRGAYVTAAVRCAPPGNRPRPEELDSCRPYLEREMELLEDLRVVVALGAIAWRAVLDLARRRGLGGVGRPAPRFGHAASAALALRPGEEPLLLLGSYHPSQQNTQTGRLTPAMLDRVLARAVREAFGPRRSRPTRSPFPRNTKPPAPAVDLQEETRTP